MDSAVNALAGVRFPFIKAKEAKEATARATGFMLMRKLTIARITYQNEMKSLES